LKRSLRSGVRHLLGVPADESLQSFVERRGERAYRSVERLMQGLGIAPLPPADPDAHEPHERAARPEPTKFDLGQKRDVEPPREHIPWGYGRDRVTAMPVDPDRLYVYWEVTDDAMAAARRGLGAAGESAWLNLRVYDVTGRIFDGTNAHHYLDHRVERHDRQWFLTIGRPASTACVEVGMKSSEGYFVRIARSSRVDFPRAEPAPPGDVEWMSVRVATGEIEGSHTTAPPPSPASPPVQPVNGAAPAALTTAPPDQGGATLATRNGTRVAATERRWALGDGATEWLEVVPGTWHEIRSRHEWIGDVEHTSWEAGPFPHPVEAPPLEVIESRAEHGRVVETEDGTHVVEWPWEVTIRGLGAHVERRVLARWEIVRSVEAEPAVEASPEGAVVALGGSEQLGRGASERRAPGASELRLAGASEEFLLGASELRYRGASERVYAGASERRWLGASERIGASEGIWRLGAGGEWRPAGASEHRLGGASEHLHRARASWQAFAEEGSRLVAAAVESAGPPPIAVPAGASERRLEGSEARLGVVHAASDPTPVETAHDGAPGVRPVPPRW
jgi:hypothetical protein